MGVVYKGERVQLGRPVAIKFLHPWIASQAAFRSRFETEARAMSRLAHPHCVSVIDFGTDGGPYLVMDYVTGRTLREVMDGGPLPADRALRIVRQLLAGLAHAHAQGIIHRDLKPENLILGVEAGLEDHLRILDFGLAKLRDGPAMTTGLAVGTPSYMSPEQTGEGAAIDARTDLYAVGVLLFELLAGQKPFQSEKVGELILMHREAPPPALRTLAPSGKFSAEIEAVILKAMAKGPDARFQTAADFAAALDATPEGSPAGRAPAEAPAKPAGTPASASKAKRPAPAPDATIVESPSMIRRRVEDRPSDGKGALALLARLGLDRRRALAVGAGLAAGVLLIVVIAMVRGGRHDGGGTAARATATPSVGAGSPASGPGAIAPPAGPDNPRLEEARRLLVQGQWEEAVAVLNRLRAEDPNNADAPYMLANIYLDNKRWSDGVAAAQVAIHKNPALKADPDLIKAVIRSLVADRSYDKSEAVLRNMGAAATPFIKEAAHHDESPKVRERAGELLASAGGGRRGFGSSPQASGGSMFHR
jgi:serine/threonine-protein kinase